MSGLVERLRQVFAEHGDVLETHLLRLEARVDALRAIQEAHATALADLRFAVAAKEPVVGFFVVPTAAGLAEWAQYPRTHGPFSGASARFVPGELAKMERYCKKGDHLTAQEILAYLDRRDALVA